jgi:WD40 repeat protein
MKHEGSVSGAVFSKDESRILTWSKHSTARLWNIDADYDFPKEHLPLLVEVCTGTAMDDFGNVRALNKEEWETRKQEYIRISEDHLKTCKHKSANIYLNRQKPFWGNANQD